MPTPLLSRSAETAPVDGIEVAIFGVLEPAVDFETPIGRDKCSGYDMSETRDVTARRCRRVIIGVARDEQHGGIRQERMAERAGLGCQALCRCLLVASGSGAQPRGCES